MAEFYGISTDLEGCSITPLHYLFARYISDGSKIAKLLDKIQKISPKETNIKSLVRLTKKGSDPRKIEEDSFLDGGLFLLWCLKND